MANAALDAWTDTSDLTDWSRVQARYLERWSWYAGTMFDDLSRHSRLMGDPRVYANTSLIYKHVRSVVDFYATTVYQGDLSTDGQPLPDGTRGAIPIDPQVTDKVQAENIRRGIAELWAMWNWRQNMTLRPQFGAALGDVLTELIDDTARGVVYPSIVRPWHVPEIEINHVGDVKRYVVEYQTEDAKGQAYRYRKEIDKRAFRYYRDDRPDNTRPGGAEEENPYGFVPAIWDRHRIGWGERGIAATDDTRQALLQLNSLLSHSFDFQRKAFAAPIIVRGRLSRPGQTVLEVDPGGMTASQDPGFVDRMRNRMADRGSRIAESLGIMETGDPAAAILQPQFDIGQTLAIIQFLKDGILEENPEGSFYHDLREMSELTGPGAERALGDAASRCRLARAGYDAQSIKKNQMSLAVAGYRVNAGDWETDIGNGKRTLTARQRAFAPFGLDSYAKGELDHGISDRPVVLPTRLERINEIAAQEALQTTPGLAKVGWEDAEIAAIVKERREAAAMPFGEEVA